MLLTPEDLFTHFPDDSLENLELKITQATSLISSYLVANRDLNVKKYYEIKSLNVSRNVLLTYLPVLNNLINYPIKVEIRNIYANTWLTLDNFSVDFDLGEILINPTYSDRWSSIWNAPRSHSFRNERGSGRNTNQIKISYYSGIDLSDLENSQEFKNNLINLIKFQSSDSNAGLKRFKLDQHYEVEYQNSSERVATKKDSSPLNDLLAYFKKFKPRTFSS